MESQDKWEWRRGKKQHLKTMAAQGSLTSSNQKEVRSGRAVSDTSWESSLSFLNEAGTSLAMQGKPKVRKSLFAVPEGSLS